MREYVLTLIGAALVTSLASMIAPEGKLGKYIAFAGGLCILCVSISPIYSFISGRRLMPLGISPISAPP